MGNCRSGLSTRNAETLVQPVSEGVTPFSQSLSGVIEACRGGTVILSGCGGGCDVYGTAVLLHRLKDVAHDFVLTNLTFTERSLLEEFGKPITRHVHRIEPGVFYHHKNYSPYFPEALFANAVKRPVYAINRDATMLDIVAGYRAILAAHKCKAPRAVFLADGGSDILFTGDEQGFATPAEDMLHLRSVMAIPASHRAVLTLGFNINCGRGVVQSEIDGRLSELRDSGAILFEELLSMDRKDAAYYQNVVEKCDPVQTVVHSLVCAAIEGHRGTYTPPHLVSRISKSVVPLTDQTATLFGFDMDAVASGVKYLDRLLASSDVLSVRNAIKAYKSASKRRLNATNGDALPPKASVRSPVVGEEGPRPLSPLLEEAHSEGHALTA